MLIQVSNKKYMYFEIDDEDFDKIKKYKWSIYSGYIKSWINNKEKVFLHRFLFNLSLHDGKMIDHKDGNPLNNKKENLRLCDYRQNIGNSKLCKRNISGYKGVTWNKEKQKWQSRIRDNGIEKHLGYYNDKIEAAKAYDKKAKEVFGVFARLNFEDTL